MAWTTVAESNDALVNRLAHLQIIKSAPIEGAFRITDRGEFIGEKRWVPNMKSRVSFIVFREIYLTYQFLSIFLSYRMTLWF